MKYAPVAYSYSSFPHSRSSNEAFNTISKKEEEEISGHHPNHVSKRGWLGFNVVIRPLGARMFRQRARTKNNAFA